MPRPLSATAIPHAVSPTEAAILWTECLHGAGDLRGTMISLSRCVRAVSVMLIRATLQPQRQRIISSFDSAAASGALPLTRPLGLDLITIPPHRARTGSLWSLRDPNLAPQDSLHPQQIHWLAQRAIADVIVLVLGQNGSSIDLLEFHLEHRANTRDLAQIEDLGQAIAFAWNRRPTGRVARMLSNAPGTARRLQPDQPETSAPLSSANPWQLTPTELRICGLIRDGLAATDIVATFGIAESTIRSHLRSIYAKAGVTGQVGLVHKLLEGTGGRAAMH